MLREEVEEIESIRALRNKYSVGVYIEGGFFIRYLWCWYSLLSN